MIPVILSGGSGTRLWPLSRAKTPKQFCHFFEQTLQEMTLRRLTAFGSPWIVTNKGLRDQTVLQLKQLQIPLEHLILEPVGRNTAPAIALLCHVLRQNTDRNQLVGIFPADQLITQEKSFQIAVRAAESEAARGKVVTLGIRPYYPATGFGYIQTSSEVPASARETLKSVERFHEKPDLPTAKKFLQSGLHYWNAGIFIFQIGTMADLLRLHQPEMWRLIESVQLDLSNLETVYSQIKNISIDYAIIEKLGPTELSCVPCDMGWDDVGSWDAIAEIKGKLETPNHVTVDSENNYVHTLPDKLYSFAGVDDLIVVDTKDALLITRRGQSQKVKEVVEQVGSRAPSLLQQHPDEERPWGGFEVLKNTDSFKSKVVFVNPGQQISYQSHTKREEHWLVVEGRGVVVLDEQDIPVERGSYVKIPLQAKHRIRNTGTSVMKFVEVQLGSYFGEDDITRYQDDYSRT
ncbi:MAG: mannose-1-phosphate guanylyltransferase/mannose-6-phosphate isomerase [Bdellovibrionaceae bacterium]|nr:mannose-1-phosphate guanylyltransferase/mannose-6-phosphate isomerase [Pseudobdellovibrionaceae bacterium]